MDELSGSENDWQQRQTELSAHAKRGDPDLIRFDPDRLSAQLRAGMAVFTQDGYGIGDIKQTYQTAGIGEIDPDPWEVYMRVDPGLLRPELFIPSRLVGHIADDAVRLTATRRDLGGMTLDRPEFIPE